MAGTGAQIVVAKARIHESPDVEAVAPPEIRVKAGEPLCVQYLYRVDEASREREVWKFLLQSNVGTEQRGPISRRWSDRWGLKDRFWGLLEQIYVFDKPGLYPANFKVEAAYDRSKWRSDESQETRRRVAGSFQVRVHA